MSELDDIRALKDEAARATQASQVLNSPIYIEAITMMKVDAIGLFEKSKQSDSNQHKEAWLQLNAINEFESNLKYIMENGEFAKQNLNLLEKAKNIINF